MSRKKNESQTVAGSSVPVLLAILLMAVLAFVTQERASTVAPTPSKPVSKPFTPLVSATPETLSGPTNEPTQAIHGQKVAYTIQLPSNWKTQSILLDGVDNLSASKDGANLAVIVREPKMTTSEAAAAALSSLKRSDSELQSSKPETVDLDGKPWLAFQVRCQVANERMAYQYYVYSGPDGTYQIIAWTDEEGFQREWPSLQTIIRSFRFPRASEAQADN